MQVKMRNYKNLIFLVDAFVEPIYTNETNTAQSVAKQNVGNDRIFFVDKVILRCYFRGSRD